jgi:hypothetical protein
MIQNFSTYIHSKSHKYGVIIGRESLKKYARSAKDDPIKNGRRCRCCFSSSAAIPKKYA